MASSKSPAPKNAKTSAAPQPAAKPAHKRPYHHAPIKLPTWQNPLVDYWAAHQDRFRPKPRTRQKRVEHGILAMLATFSVSIGLWEVFRQLWLQSNGFSAAGVSTILSLGMLLSVACIILVGKIVQMSKIKRFMTGALIFRSVILLLLAFLNSTGLWPLIAILSAFEVVSGALIVTSVYPLLTTVMKSNHAYSRRKLVEYLFRDVGVLVGGIIIGQHLGSYLVDYNSCLIVALIFAVAATIIMARLDIRVTESAPRRENFSAVKFVWRHRIHRNYMIYVFVSSVAHYSAVGLRVLMLTGYFDLSAGMATTYLLIVGFGSDILGILALRRFTPKNDYLSMGLKYGTRLLIFLTAFISGNYFLCFLGLTWTLLSYTTYENISDGYYINAVDNRHQLKYNTLRYVVSYSGEALGLFLCGLVFNFGPGAILGLSGAILVPQLFLNFRLIKERETYGFNRLYPKPTKRAKIKQ